MRSASASRLTMLGAMVSLTRISATMNPVRMERYTISPLTVTEVAGPTETVASPRGLNRSRRVHVSFISGFPRHPGRSRMTSPYKTVYIALDFITAYRISIILETISVVPTVTR